MSAPNETPVTQARTDPALPLENERHELFAIALAGGATKADAARKAKFKAKSARKTGWDLYQLPGVRARIDFLKAQILEDAGAEAHIVVREMMLLARSDLSHYRLDAEGMPVAKANAPEGAMRAVKRIKRVKKEWINSKGSLVTQITTQLELHGKDAQLTNALKHLGILKDKVEHTGKDGAPIAHDHAHTITVRFVKPNAPNGNADDSAR